MHPPIIEHAQRDLTLAVPLTSAPPVLDDEFVTACCLPQHIEGQSANAPAPR